MSRVEKSSHALTHPQFHVTESLRCDEENFTQDELVITGYSDVINKE